MPKQHIKHDYKHTQQLKLKKTKKNRFLKPTFLIPLIIITGIMIITKYKTTHNSYNHNTMVNSNKNKQPTQKPTKTYDLQITA